MSLDTIVNVSISATSTSVKRTGFGVPLIAAYFPTSVFPERVRTFTDLADMVTAGFTVNHPAYKAASKLLSQNPSVSSFKIGRRADPVRPQLIHLVPTDTTENTIQAVTIVSPDGSTTDITYTNGAAESVASIVTAMTPLVDAVVGLSAADGTTQVTVTADTNVVLFDFHTFSGGLRVNDVTTDGAIATELSAIELYDSDWYGLILDNNSEDEVTAAAAWVETRTKVFGASTPDLKVLNATAGNILKTLKTASYTRTFVLFNQSVLSYAGAAWIGDRFQSDPGSSTWAYKTLAGITVDNLTPTQKTNISDDNGNHYTEIAGVNVTLPGKVASGEFIDVTRFIDWLTSRLQERIFALLVNAEKIPFTDPSVDKFKSEILSQLGQGVTSGGLAADPPPTVTAPVVADVSAANKVGRILPDVKFQAQLAGAIHSTVIAGVLTV